MKAVISVPELNTERLTLKRLAQTDAEGIFALRSNPDVIRYTGIRQYTSVEEATAYIARIDSALARGESVVWSMRLAADNAFVGSISLWGITPDGSCAEIGYDSLLPFHGKGLVGEAAKAVIRHGFYGMGLSRIVADLCTENVKSVRLLERNGFQKGSVHTEDDNGQACEMAVYTLERANYEARQQS